MQEKFEQAFRDHADALFRHAYFRLSRQERAEELVQDTFMKTWNHLARGGTIENWKAFLFRVLNNAIVDEYRKKKSTSLDALLEKEDVHEGMFADLHTDGREEQESVHDHIFNEAILKKALDTLRPEDAQLIVWRSIDERSIGDIAESLGESENVVSVRVHRAHVRLKKGIEKIHHHTPFI